MNHRRPQSMQVPRPQRDYYSLRSDYRHRDRGASQGNYAADAYRDSNQDNNSDEYQAMGQDQDYDAYNNSPANTPPEDPRFFDETYQAQHGRERDYSGDQGYHNYGSTTAPLRGGRETGAGWTQPSRRQIRRSLSNSQQQESHIGKGPKGYQRSDERIREEVCERLAASPDVDASDVDVSVDSGTVILSGHVENRIMKRAAEDSVMDVVGVVDVRNDLRLKVAGNAWTDSSDRVPSSKEAPRDAKADTLKDGKTKKVTQ